MWMWLVPASASLWGQPAAQVQTQPAPHQHSSAQDTSELFPARESSGTAWLPDETPMYGVHHAWRVWQVMVHGTAFAQYLYEPDDVHRTGGFSTHQFGSINWGMAMFRRPLGSGRLGLRAMASLEPVTLPGCGYLNVLATGEMCDGDTIHDRQHPHDLFMELAADYDRPVRGSLRWQVYAGFAGEPALGPPSFPHRTSAMSNPLAPISHHWIDSTHITFGLVTTGVYNRQWKAEMSVFNAREPDEHRADLDLGALDSISGRLTYSPNARLVIQASAGHLREAEAEFPPEPRADVNRGSASITYHRPRGDRGVWATTLAWGVNSGIEIVPGGAFDAATHAVLLESTLTFGDRHTWFGRGEIVEKPAHDLHAHEFPTSVFTLGKLEGGYVRYFRPWKGMSAGVGGTISAAIVPPELAVRYYGRVAPGFGVFLTLRPSRHSM